MKDHSRRHPALDLAWPPAGSDVVTLPERLAVALDDLEVAAVHEFDAAWRVFFRSARARDRARRVLSERFRVSGVGVSSIDVPDEDWASRSQADLQPVRIGDVVVAPPWSPVPTSAADNGVLIRILPSMGFGTGHHATTKLCLRVLQEIEIADRSFLDIGTGSGVLAIAACLLGARPVTAIDSDSDAVDSARDNLRLNGIEGRVRVVTLDFRTGAGLRAHTVAANLTGAALIRGQADLAACVDPGGILAVSGFTHDEAATVLSALAHAGDVTKRYQEDGWCAATLRVRAERENRHD